MMRRFPPVLWLLAATFLASGCRIEIEDTDDSNVQVAVERMLAESAEAWNRGDLSGFMDDYLESGNTTYIGGPGLVTGYDSIVARYAPYFDPGAARDSLRFEAVRVRRLAAVDALATARYILYRGDTITASGPFTLVLRHTSRGWKIIHDHSSSDPPPLPPAE
jgi:ketosteroid isomerase-like protein